MITIDATVTAGSYDDAWQVRTRLLERLSDHASVSAPFQGGGLHGEAGWQISIRLGEPTDPAWAADVDNLLKECRQILDGALIH